MDDHQHTCLACGVTFAISDLQREHYKTDWHRYNLKRRVAEFAPVTLQRFQEMIHSEDVKALASENESSGYCAACRKSFKTIKAYDNHLRSKKHKETKAQFDLKKNKLEIENNRLNRKTDIDQLSEFEDDDDEYDSEIEELDSDEWDEEDEDKAVEPIGNTDCLFCSHHSRDVEKSLIHMSERHSFFLPDFEYLTDLEGLLDYLGEKVGCALMCLYCNQRSKRFLSLEAVQQHMTDKGHCKLQHDNGVFVEYARFYDYTTSYPAGKVPEENEDAEVQLDSLDDSGYELTLPSGRTVGHRSLMRYYRQNLKPERQVAPVRSAHTKILNRYKALGWDGLTASEAKQKAKDLKFMQRVQQKHWTKLGVKANRLQKHFVDPAMFC